VFLSPSRPPFISRVACLYSAQASVLLSAKRAVDDGRGLERDRAAAGDVANWAGGSEGSPNSVEGTKSGSEVEDGGEEDDGRNDIAAGEGEAASTQDSEETESDPELSACSSEEAVAGDGSEEDDNEEEAADAPDSEESDPELPPYDSGEETVTDTEREDEGEEDDDGVVGEEEEEAASQAERIAALENLRNGAAGGNGADDDSGAEAKESGGAREDGVNPAPGVVGATSGSEDPGNGSFHAEGSSRSTNSPVPTTRPPVLSSVRTGPINSGDVGAGVATATGSAALSSPSRGGRRGGAKTAAAGKAKLLTDGNARSPRVKSLETPAAAAQAGDASATRCAGRNRQARDLPAPGNVVVYDVDDDGTDAMADIPTAGASHEVRPSGQGKGAVPPVARAGGGAAVETAQGAATTVTERQRKLMPRPIARSTGVSSCSTSDVVSMVEDDGDTDGGGGGGR